MKQDFDIHSEQIAKNAYQAILRNWAAIKVNGEVLRVSLCIAKKKRSNPQNALYWVLVAATAQQLWIDGKQFTEDSIHEHFKREFLPEVCKKQSKVKWIDIPNGDRVLNMSTTDLDTAEFSDFYTKVEAYAVGELGVVFG